jgi:hypothetical protein
VKQELEEARPRLELWWHPHRRERYVVLVTGSGVQMACGPLSDSDMRAIQQDESNIRWSAKVGAAIDAGRDEFVVSWPPPAPLGPALQRPQVSQAAAPSKRSGENA